MATSSMAPSRPTATQSSLLKRLQMSTLHSCPTCSPVALLLYLLAFLVLVYNFFNPRLLYTLIGLAIALLALCYPYLAFKLLGGVKNQ